MASRGKKPKYNEQFFRSMGGPGPTVIGALMVLLIVFGLYMAFAKQLPFTDPGYELNATFANAANIRTTSPVRIAGVNVGEVTEVSRDGENATVTFTVKDEGLPIHEDASALIRPRIFLEGNFFVDLDPGSPSSPEMDEDGTIPVTRTATSVQLDEILTSLQSETRENLEVFLSGFGTALTYEPLPPDDVGQDPDVQGESAATALNQTWDYGGPAGRYTAEVNQAFLGTQRHDLSKLLVAGERVFGELSSREEQLKGLISNFNDFTGALASQSTALSETVALLEPTLLTTRRSLTNLNLALPPLRGYAIALQPAVSELPATIEAGLPWLAQAYPLLSNPELGGVARELAEGTPAAAASIQETIELLPELTEFNRCVDENLIPTGNVVLEDSYGQYDFSSGVQNYKEFFQAAVNIAGESQDFDGNGSYVRLQPGGGPVAVRDPNPIGGFEAHALYGNTISKPLGTRPAWGPRPPIRSDVPCYDSERPNLNGPAAAAGPPSPVAYGTNQNPEHAMTKAIRTYFTDFIAIIVVAALALATLLYILANQKAALPSWIPGLGQEFYELNAEFSTSQSVTAGQGQGIMISGIQVGRVGEVNLENGHAVVRMDIEPKYAELIHEDARLLLRPKTGLNDMVIEVDPGTEGDTPPEGSSIPMAQTAPNINPDEVLATLDADTRDYLTLLLQGGAEGIGGQGRQLSAGLRRFEPTARDLARLGRVLAARRKNIRGVIHNFRLVAEELGDSDSQLARFIDASNAALGAFAEQQDALAQSVAELPPTLRSTQVNLGKANELSVTLAPALLALIPQAVELQPALESTQNLFTDTLSPIRDQIRPFTRQIQPTIRHLNQASEPLERTAAGSKAAFGDLNNLFAKLAFNPRGSQDEGYLFWLTWLNHATNAIYLTQDAEGPLHRGLLTVTCSTVKFGELTAIGNALLKTELEATDLPQPAEVCANYTPLPTIP